MSVRRRRCRELTVGTASSGGASRLLVGISKFEIYTGRTRVLNPNTTVLQKRVVRSRQYRLICTIFKRLVSQCPVHCKGQARGIKVIKVTKKAIILHSPPPRLLGDPLACRNFDSTHGFQDLTDGLEQNSERLAPWQHSYQLGTSLLNAGHPSKPKPSFIHTTELAARRNCNRFRRHVSQLVNEGRKIPKSRVWSSALSVRLRSAR